PADLRGVLGGVVVDADDEARSGGAGKCECGHRRGERDPRTRPATVAASAVLLRSLIRRRRPSVDVLELVRLARDDEEVEGEHPRPHTSEEARGRVGRDERPALADHVPDGWPEPTDALHLEPSVSQQAPERVDGEEPAMGEIEDPALSVIELPEEKAR